MGGGLVAPRARANAREQGRVHTFEGTLRPATGADVPFYEGKVATARYFFRHELVKTRAQAELLGSLETSALDVRPGHF